MNFFEPFKETMNLNRHLKVMIAGGVYDLNTPYFATLYSINHIGLHPALHANLSFRKYAGGHQMYIDAAALDALRGDAEGFMRETMSVPDETGR
jgi:carboxypeptidase C (cathepsin A)